MRYGGILVPAATLAGGSFSPEASFEEGMKALAAKDFLTALARMEAALSSGPDNIRFASEYRQAVIRAHAYDRCLDFFAKLVAAAPHSANAYLNYGFAYVDKIPVAGSITQVILANNALSCFTKSLELKATWIDYYTRGNSYLYWPKDFRTGALRAGRFGGYHGHAEGRPEEELPQSFRAPVRCVIGLAREGDDLKTYLDDVLNPSKRVDTNLQELWMNS